MTTCRPDISYTSVKLSQSNSAPAEHHYHGMKHAIRYIYITRHDGIYFWRTCTRDELPAAPLPTVNSNIKDLLLDGFPNTMRILLWHTATRIGRHAWRHAHHLAVFVSSLPVGLLLAKQNSNPQWLFLPPRRNSWRLTMSDGCAYLSAVFYGTSTFHRKRLR
jgi:hypothetical protein